MSAPDRLAELQRQRALVRDHLAWLDREINSETQGTTRGSQSKPPETPIGTMIERATSVSSESPVARTRETSSATGANLGPAGATDAEDIVESSDEADSIMDRYRVGTTDLHRDVRRGCLLYFGIALAFLTLAVVGLYFVVHR